MMSKKFALSGLQYCRWKVLFLSGLFLCPATGQLFAQEVLKANNTDYLNLGSSWVGGVAPGAGDVAVWTNVVTSANTSDISNNWSVGGIKVANPGGNIGIGAVTLNNGLVAANSTTDIFTYTGGDVINGGIVSFTNSAGGSIPAGLFAQQIYFIVNVDTVNKTFQISDTEGGTAINFTSNGGNLYQFARPALTLGATGINLSSATRNLPLFSAPVMLSANQTWTVASGRTLDSNNNGNFSGLAVMNSGHTLTFDGAGTIDIGQLHGTGGIVKDGSGRVNVHSGNYTFTGNVVLNAGTLNAGSTLGALGSGASTLMLNGGTLTFAANGARNYARNTTISGNVAILNNSSTGNGSQNYSFGTLSIGSHTVTVTANGTVTNEASIVFGSTTLTGSPVFDVGSRTNNVFQLGAISESGGSHGLTKTGTGMMILSGNNTYSGVTDIQAGQLKLGVDGTLAGTSLIDVGAGAILGVSLLSGGLILTNGQVLSGSGQVEGDVTAGPSAVLSPGNGTAIDAAKLTVGALTLGDGGTFVVDMINATNTGTPGVDWDLIEATSVVLPSSGTFTIKLTGNPPDFINSVPYSWTIVDGPVTGFYSNKFVIDTSDFEPSTGDGQFSVKEGSLVLTFTPAPTAVVLFYFRAVDEEGRVVIKWETASEKDTSGFFIERWDGSIWVRLNQYLIPARGENGGGATYSMIDEAALPGEAYRYRLIEIEGDGDVLVYGPFDRIATALEVVSPIRPRDNGIEIRWLSREGESFDVLRSDCLHGGFTNLIASDVPATVPENVFLDASPAPVGFYQIRLVE